MAQGSIRMLIPRAYIHDAYLHTNVGVHDADAHTYVGVYIQTCVFPGVMVL